MDPKTAQLRAVAKKLPAGIDTRVLRTYVRQRKNLLATCSDSVRRMQKSLEPMNIEPHVVISGILGKTGMSMVKATVGGERDPEKLPVFKDSRIKAGDEGGKRPLNGIWKEEYPFMLGQSYREYRFYQSQIKECDAKIEDVLTEMAAKKHDGEITDVKKKSTNI